MDPTVQLLLLRRRFKEHLQALLPQLREVRDLANFLSVETINSATGVGAGLIQVSKLIERDIEALPFTVDTAMAMRDQFPEIRADIDAAKQKH
jgi:hypothetical protein